MWQLAHVMLWSVAPPVPRMPPPPGPGAPPGPPVADWYQRAGPSHAWATPTCVRSSEADVRSMCIVFMGASVRGGVAGSAKLRAAEPLRDRLVVGVRLGEEVHAGVRFAAV